MVRDSLPTLGPHLLVNVLCQGRSSVGRELFLGCCTVISAVNDLLVEELDLEKRRAYTTRHITWHLFTYLKLHCIFIFNDHLEVVSLKLWDPNCWFAFPSRWNNVFPQTVCPHWGVLTVGFFRPVLDQGAPSAGFCPEKMLIFAPLTRALGHHLPACAVCHWWLFWDVSGQKPAVDGHPKGKCP